MVDRSQAIPCGVFELSKFIGDGSTGQVWKGTHSVQGIDVAVKILDVGTKRSWNERRFIKESFEKEIEAITSLNHPGIVRIFDVGRTDQQTADQSEGIIAADQPYIAMEYAPEGALRHHSRVSRWLDLKHLLFQLLDALAYAHSREVLHRDIKPENVLVFLPDDDDQKRPEPADDVTYELTDFGLAHPLSSENMATKDVFEAGAGTPTYMAPEQLKKEWRAFGPWTDLYSLGCMIYEITCGQSPYRGDTVAEVMMKHLKSDIPPIEPDFPVPDEFAVWLERLMAKQPRDRFECAADAAYALSLFTSESTRESTQSVDPGPDESDEETLQSWSTAEYFPSEDSEETESVEKSGVYRSSRSSAITSQSRRQTQRQTGRFGGDEGIEDPEEFEPPPPVPSSWFVELPPLPAPPIAGAGIALVGQREVPLVDRADERDLLWDRFRTCSEADAPKITLLSGEFGVGKSRLGTWLGRRISELGVGRTIVCEHGTDAYESNSLPRMVERFFGTWNLEKSEIATQILQRLETMTGLEADQQLKYESVQLASLAILNKRRPPEDRQTARKLSTEERFEVVTRLLERLGRRRVPVVVFDDVDRSREALDFVDHIGRLDEPPGCFFILTADTDGADPSQLEEPIERLPNAIDFRRVDVSPLAEDHVDRFVRYLLKFEDGSRERLVDISRGYPRVVIDLVVHLIDTDQLRLTDDGYVVPAGDDLNFPDAIRKAYRETIGESLPD